MTIVQEIKNRLIPYKCSSLKRYGGDYDGGYIFKSDLVKDTKYVYSYGVGPNDGYITFDKEMASLGKDVYLYDASVSDPWWQEPHFHFTPEYVNSQNILNHIKQNGHTNETNMVLKMDIEGNEFETLINCDESLFSHFNQIGIEIHDVLNSHVEPYYVINAQNPHLRWLNKINLFDRLNKHYKLVHIHGNNCSMVKRDGMADVLELTYVRKDCMPNNPEISDNSCPREDLDFKNSHDSDDIYMDWWTHL
jgi:Methyltransferase FkbM domain